MLVFPKHVQSAYRKAVMPGEKIYIRLWFLLGVLVLGIVTGGYWFYHHHDANRKGRIVEQLHAIAALKVEDIQRWRQEQIADASTFLGTPFILEATRQMALGKLDPEMMEGIVTRLYNLKKHYRYQDVLLVTPEGEIFIGTGGRSGPIHEEALVTLPRAFETRQPVLTDIHVLPQENKPHFDCIVPFQIQDPQGVYQPVFAVILRIDISLFFSPYIENWPIPSDSAETLLVRAEGNVVRYLNKLRHSETESFTLTVPMDRDEIPAVQAVKGKIGYTEGRDYRGVPVLAYMLPVPDTSWILIAKIDREEAFRQAAFEARMIFVLMTAGIFAVLTGVGLIYHRTREKQFKTLYMAEQQLRQSELRYKATLMSIGDGVIVTDSSGKVKVMNPVAEVLTGWPLSEAEGLPIETVFSILNEQTRACVENPVHRVCREGCIVGLANHTILIHREGKEIPIADCGSPIPGPDGGLDGVVLVFRDQSRERAAENAIRDAHTLLRLVLDTVPVRVFWKDTEGRYLGCNLAFATDNGLESVEEVIGKSDWDFHRPETAARFHAEDMEVIRSNIPKRLYDVSVTLPDGRSVWQLVSKTPLCNTDGAVQGVLGTYQDITVLKTAEIREKRKTATDAAIADLSRHLLEPQSDIARIAPLVLERCLKLTNSPHGYVGSIDERKEGLFLDAVQGEGPCMKGDLSNIHFRKGPDGRFPGLWGCCLNSGETFVIESPSTHPAAAGVPDGHIPLNRLLTVPIVVENELIGQIAVANSDEAYAPDTVAAIERIGVLYGMFLRLKRMGSKLSDAEARLFQTQKMEAIGRLAGGVAHDFNNMIQVIQSFSELARQRIQGMEGDLSADVCRYLDRIQQTAEKSGDLTQKLLAFARKQTTTPRRIDLNDTIETMLKMVRRLIGENIELLWKPGSHLEHIFIDPSQIDQILINLTVNARDAIDGTGTITVETRGVHIDAAYVRKHPFMTPGRYIVMSVADTGCGMDEKTMSMIYEPFFTTKPVGKGTGLGLSTVYGIMKQNNGHITVYSEPGKGTVFHLYFPACPSDTDADRPLKSQMVQRGTETILLVEDDAVLLEVTQMSLETLGYTVLAASQPSAAIWIARTHPGTIHLLMTDMIMPEMNGKQLAEVIQGYRPDIGCLFMSGYTQDVFSPDGKLDPNVHFIQKPFALAVLSKKIREAMGDAS